MTGGVRGRPRPIGHARRTRTVKRRSAGLSPARAGALLAMLVSAAAVYGAGASGAFGFRNLTVHGSVLTSDATIRRAIGVHDGQNLFLVSSATLASRVEALPAVDRADVAIGLPSTVVVDVTERRPILVWSVGGRRFLADAHGLLFAEQPDTATGATPALPVVTDERAADAELRLGSSVDAIDFDVARRLGSLRPVDIGSAAAALRLTVTDADGFVMRPSPAAWTAVFGFYTPTLRPPALIPDQVRLLHDLLAEGETKVSRVVLATGGGGTYQPRPSASAMARPSASAKP